MLSRLPREFWLVVSIVALGFFLHVRTATGPSTSTFLTAENIKPILRDSAMLGIFALGTGIIVIAGGIDLSSGAVICLTALVCAKSPEWISTGVKWFTTQSFCPGFLANFLTWLQLDVANSTLSVAMLVATVLFTLLAGYLVGELHAILINWLNLPPFVATLATMAGLRSLANTLTTGTVEMSDPTIGKLVSETTIWIPGVGQKFAIPNPVIVCLIEFVLLGVLMRFMRLGRHLEALGGNEQAARLNGLNISRLKRIAYLIGALTATLASFVYLAHIGSIEPTSMGKTYELKAIAAAVVGGCNLRGGSGSLSGVLLGALLLEMVTKNTVHVFERGGTEMEGLVLGIVVIVAVFVGRIAGDRRS